MFYYKNIYLLHIPVELQYYVISLFFRIKNIQEKTNKQNKQTITSLDICMIKVFIDIEQSEGMNAQTTVSM